MIPRKSMLVCFSLRIVRLSQYSFTAAQEGKNLVVIGSSFISMEIVAAVSKRRLASINVIGMEEFPFEAVLGKEIGAGLKKVHISARLITTRNSDASSPVSRIARRQVSHGIKSRKDRCR